MEEKCEIELTEGYHSINSRDVRLHIHKGISQYQPVQDRLTQVHGTLPTQVYPTYTIDTMTKAGNTKDLACNSDQMIFQMLILVVQSHNRPP